MNSFVFPLPLVPFERYMMVDDRPEHPMVFTVVLRFRGTFQREAFECGLRQALARHPLLASRVRQESPNQLAWVPAEFDLPWIDYGGPTDSIRFPGTEQIDLTQKTGLRVWVRGDAESTKVQFQGHHACCDGVGVLGFLEDLLVAYDHAANDRADPVPHRPLDVSLLSRRAKFGLSWLGVLAQLPAEACGLIVGTLQFAYFFRPEPLGTPEVPRPTQEDFSHPPEWPVHTFDVGATTELIAAARRRRVTLNDLMLRDLTLVAYDWNMSLSPRKRRRGIRVTFPVNLRVAGDDQLPATNVMGMLFIDRRPFHWPTSRLLLAGIHWETWFLNRFRFGLSHSRSCAMFGLFPGGMELLTQAKRCLSTTLFSNLGRIFVNVNLNRENGKLRAGGLVLEEVVLVPPTRPYTHAVFSAYTYADRLTLVMNYNRRHFTAAAARALLDRLVGQLEKSRQEGSGRRVRRTKAVHSATPDQVVPRSPGPTIAQSSAEGNR